MLVTTRSLPVPRFQPFASLLHGLFFCSPYLAAWLGDFREIERQHNMQANHALQRTRPSRLGCHRGVPQAGSLSLGRSGRKMKRTLGILIAALVIAFILFVYGSKARRVAANTIIEQVGEYRSPKGTCSLIVTRADGDALRFQVAGRTDHGPATQSPKTPFPRTSAWFMCWDSQDRLWTYVPNDGVRYWHFTAEACGSCLVGALGGTEGMPLPFYNRLPAEVKATLKAAEKNRSG